MRLLLFVSTLCLSTLASAQQCLPNDPESDCDMDTCRRGVAGAINSYDCNDNDSAIRGPLCPGGAATEVCDGKDNNCNGSTDEGNPGGGAACVTGLSGVCSPGVRQCQGGSVKCTQNVQSSAEVCDNLDNNCNGQVDENNPGGGGACNTGLQGVCAAGTRQCQAGAVNCVQNTAASTEICDGLDNDCDGQVDEGFNVGTACTAAGQQGVCAAGTLQCQGGVASCKPGPSTAEVCDSLDNDCDGQVDENLNGGACTVNNQQGVCRNGAQQCSNGVASCQQTVQPSAEQCDGLDNNCDGQTDNGIATVGDACTTGQSGVCAAGVLRCNNNGGFGIRCVRSTSPSTEVCDGLDNDCDGTPDDNVNRVCYAGPAGSFTGNCPTGTSCMPRGACRGVTQVCGGGAFATCNAAVPGQVFPVAETCNGIDDDCNGVVDDGLAGGACSTGQQGVCAAGTERCVAGALSCVRNTAPSTEQCNNLDDNCDGLIDNNVAARACFTGPASATNGQCPGVNCAARGECRVGAQQCDGAGTYGACVGSVLPSPEVCDSKDNDCNAQTDDGLLVDADQDGVRACNTCNANASPNCDCNDNDKSIRPGAVELCDNVDQNCNGRLDDVMPRVCFFGVNVTPETYSGTCPGPQCAPKGVCTAGQQACSAQGAWGDCVQPNGQPLVTPSNPPAQDEAVCNGKDDDCDGVVDDGNFDLDKDGVKSCQGDCNDAPVGGDKQRPGLPELCDGIDNDCDGTIDGNTTSCFTSPTGKAGVGRCRSGSAVCVNGMAGGACAGEIGPIAEVCNNIDDDCDGLVDEDFDADKDGVTVCGGDCDDNDAFNKPGGLEVCDCKDNNCNRQVDEGDVCRGAPCHDFDQDGFTNCQGDCNDDPATGGAVGPNRTELVGDSLDNDCDGSVDEVTDEDQDGFTNAQGDCNDKVAAINPGAAEICDGFDNNCNNKIDEGYDDDGDLVSVCAGDCNDKNALVNPTRREVCGNSIDDNCDGLVDESLDADGDGVTTCQNDCNDFNANVHPAAGVVTAAAEICDGQDNNCDGRFDEGFDNDKDFYASCFGDCNDNDKSIGPSALEVPGNGVDDNCNGQVDEGSVDKDGDGFSPICGDCNDADPAINPRAAEKCDRLDNNCDAFVDSAPGKFDICAVCFDADGDGQTNCDGDCNDADKSIFRGGTEVCDNKDNDCDGMVDLDSQTGLKVCLNADGGGVMNGNDAGQSHSDAGQDDGGVGGPGSGADRPVVATACGCSSGTSLGALLVLWLMGKSRKRVLSTFMLAFTLLLFVSCDSKLSYPVVMQPEEDAGSQVPDGGFYVDVPGWPCPGLNPIEQKVATLPGTAVLFAHGPQYEVSSNAPAQALILNDGKTDLAAFVLWRPLTGGGMQPDAVERVAERELSGLDALVGTPVVKERLERVNRVYLDDRMLRNLTTSQSLIFNTPTNAFAIRNRLVAALSQKTPADIGVLPVPAVATAEKEVTVSLFFRIDGERLFVGGVVVPASRSRENQIALADLANGSHLSGDGAFLSYACEKRVTPELKSDFLFVLDNTPSMVEEQQALQGAASSLFAAFEKSGLDFRVGVVTTDSDVLRGKGFTRNVDEFRSAARVGLDGNTTEMGLEFALRAIQRARLQPDAATSLRSGAGLVTLFLSDEDSKNIRSTPDYVAAYKAEKAIAFSIVGPRPSGCTRVGYAEAQVGRNYIDVATQTGGSSGSICNPNLSELIEEVLVGALGASNESRLERRMVSASLAVRVEMSPIERSRAKGFDYELGANAVLFFGSASPRVGAPYETAYSFFGYVQ